jgi:CheY-like chemotaxis protein
VAASIDALSSAIAAKRLGIRFDHDGHEQPAWLDPTRVQQIVWNLVSNAIKFSDDGAEIRIGLSRSADTLTLSVQDTGRGIEADFLTHLFDRFAQSDSPDNRRHGGLGLGLSIVKNLAELHGGGAFAESQGLGRGATLRVTLKVVPAPDASLILTEGHDLRLATVPERALEGLDVLVVEDDPDAREMLALVLSESGADVRLAGDYDQAMQQIHAQWPELLLSDIGLPGRDGYELMRNIRQIEAQARRSRLRAIALTAFSRTQDRVRALEAGFDNHLGKPLQPHALIAALSGRPGSG